MYVRTKTTGGKRYAYLVDGRRDGGRVRQRVVCYLGPLVTVATEIPDAVKVGAQRSDIDWDEVNRQVAKIPLTVEELSEMRRSNYIVSLGAGRAGNRPPGSRPRREGELDALSAYIT